MFYFEMISIVTNMFHVLILMVVDSYKSANACQQRKGLQLLYSSVGYTVCIDIQIAVSFFTFKAKH